MRLRFKEPERPLMRRRCPPGGGQGLEQDIAISAGRQWRGQYMITPTRSGVARSLLTWRLFFIWHSEA